MNGIEGKSLCMLGKQTISTNCGELKRLLDTFQIQNNAVDLKKWESSDTIDSYDFFKMIGFEEVHAIDYSPYEGADIICDLSEDIPEEICSKFDYVIDGGVIEHVFNTAKAMENVAKILRVKGIIIHILPGIGLIDHGFYSFSPLFFLDFYNANRFHILDLDFEFILESYENGNYGSRVIYSMDCRLFNENLQNWEKPSINYYVKSLYQVSGVQYSYIWCIAQKLEYCTIKFPIQGVYQEIYGSNDEL